MEVSLRDMKARLSAMVRLAQQGQEVTITSHRRPVALLVPVPAPGDSLDSRLVAAGLMREPPVPGGLVRRPAPLLPQGAPTLSRAVIEDRGP